MNISSEIGLVPLLGLELNVLVLSLTKNLDLFVTNFLSFTLNSHALSFKRIFKHVFRI